MFKLFARLKELSTKLPLISADKPREDRQPLADTPDFEQSHLPAVDPERQLNLGVQDRSSDIPANLYPPESHLSTSKASIAINAEPDEKLSAHLDPTTPSPQNFGSQLRTNLNNQFYVL